MQEILNALPESIESLTVDQQLVNELHSRIQAMISTSFDSGHTEIVVTIPRRVKLAELHTTDEDIVVG